ncbi:protransforming growth factor alpha isoform X2 [Parambassis ranga]|uniref:Protransforming growth factor alpha isoform X2 n=1 Tax=Parambassis ranga TaxID=210632 RepID=A0A6P7I8X0_9TELE|nr:uncharacterized protein LOC114436230 isoform X2 [Parambassis ranga]
MTRIFWDTILLISGSLFTFGAGQSSSAVIEANISIDRNPTAAPNTSSSSSVTSGSTSTTPATVTATANITTVKSSLFTFGARQTNTTMTDGTVSISTTSTAAPNSSTNSTPTNSSSSNMTNSSTAPIANTIRPVKKFVAAAVRSHFDDCPDSHRHFCFHGTCRFIILEETPACVCHPGFVGMRCEHADLLAVVATNHRQQTVAKMLVLCVIGCVLIMVLCTFLHCWWRQDCRRRRHAHHCIAEKHRTSCYPSESVV